MRGLRDQGNPSVPLWPAFTDIALAAALMLVMVVMLQQLENEKLERAFDPHEAAREAQRELRERVLEALPPEVRQDISFSADGNLQRLRFSEWVLFETADARITPSGRYVLETVGRTLRERSDLYSSLQVEGHADARPLPEGSDFPSNWELSSARATSVVRFLQEHCGLPPHLLSATGYAEYQPVSAGADRDSMRRSRRIELLLVYSVTDPTARSRSERE